MQKYEKNLTEYGYSVRFLPYILIFSRLPDIFEAERALYLGLDGVSRCLLFHHFGVGFWHGLVIFEWEKSFGLVDDVVGHCLIAAEIVP